MVDWATVAAFTGPIVGAMIGSVAWLTYFNSRREKFIATQIQLVTDRLDLRIDQIEKNHEIIQAHLEKQDDALSTAMQAIARVEGRLSAPPATTTSL